MKKLFWIVFVCGCNHGPLEYVAVDMATSDLTTVESFDLSAPDLAVPPPKPCTLRSAGDPVKTITYDNPQSSWHSEGLLARSSKEVIQYGSVSLRFGGWDDPAIIATALDVSSWPPMVTRAPTQLFFSMHSPASLFELAPDKLGLTWSFDNDGVGPQGVEFETVDISSWSTTSNVTLTPTMWGQGRPLAIGNAQFAMSILSDNHALLAIFDQTGKQLVSAQLGQSEIATLEKPGNDLLAVVPYTTCGDGDAASCSPHSLVVMRANRTASALTLDPVTTIAARNPAAQIRTPQLVSDHDRFHFLTWWEQDDTVGYLFAVPLSAAGQVAGPVEVWFTTTHIAGPALASIGSVGVVIPVVIHLQTDAGGYTREIHLIQRQLTVDAPVNDLTIDALESSFVVASQQLDDPRALIVGYNDYPGISGSAGFGMLAKYVCEED